MNKREAKFIMELPDGYEWVFIDKSFLCGINQQSEMLLYEIVDEKLIKREIKYEAAKKI